MTGAQENVRQTCRSIHDLDEARHDSGLYLCPQDGLRHAKHASEYTTEGAVAEVQTRACRLECDVHYCTSLNNLCAKSSSLTRRPAGQVVVNFWDTLFWGGANSVAEWAAKGFGVTPLPPSYRGFPRSWSLRLHSEHQPAVLWGRWPASPANRRPRCLRAGQVVLSCPDYLYLDFPNEVHPEERGYYWGTRYTDCPFHCPFRFFPASLTAFP